MIPANTGLQATLTVAGANTGANTAPQVTVEFNQFQIDIDGCDAFLVLKNDGVFVLRQQIDILGGPLLGGYSGTINIAGFTAKLSQ